MSPEIKENTPFLNMKKMLYIVIMYIVKYLKYDTILLNNTV